MIYSLALFIFADPRRRRTDGRSSPKSISTTPIAPSGNSAIPRPSASSDHDKGKALAIVGKSSLKPKHRSPLLYALLDKPAVEDFQLDLSMKSTTKRVRPPRSCASSSAFRTPNHFYYAHIAKAADPHAHSIFLVNGADRVSIAKDRTKGVEWGDKWRKIRLVRKSPEIAVYFDDMTKPVMTANDDTFKWGKVGVGSFDDAGWYDDFVLQGRREEAVSSRESLLSHSCEQARTRTIDFNTSSTHPALTFARSRKPSSCLQRTGCCSLRTAFASIWRTRSRVTLKMRPTSSSV